MVARAYRLALEEARKDLAHATQERDRWNLEIVRLQNLVKALAASALGAEQTEKVAADTPQVRISEAVEAIINRSRTPLTATEVRDALVDGGYGLGSYSNPLALVHQTLQRLGSSGKITETGSGKYWHWGSARE